MTTKENMFTCNFCGKSGDNNFLIAGPLVWICDECVGSCIDIIYELPKNESFTKMAENSVYLTDLIQKEKLLKELNNSVLASFASEKYEKDLKKTISKVYKYLKKGKR